MNIIMLGNGGHSKVIQDMMQMEQDHHIIAILDDKYDSISRKQDIIYGPLSYCNDILTADTKIIVAIGDNKARKKVVNKLNINLEHYLTMIHSSAVISSTTTIGNGTVIMPGVCINYGATIGNHCIINTGSIVEHDSIIDDYAHISPGATLTGHVYVEEGVHVGAAGTIIPGIKVGSWSIIGAGSTVINDIPSYCTAVGSPTRIVSKHEEINIEIRM